MTTHRPGALRITASRFELFASTPTGSIVQVGLDIGPDTAHVLRHLVATRVDVDSRALMDLLDTAELIVARRLPVVAVGWPDHDWDAALRSLTDGD